MWPFIIVLMARIDWEKGERGKISGWRGGLGQDSGVIRMKSELNDVSMTVGTMGMGVNSSNTLKTNK